ncbi:hypothetical protein [Marivita sp.]|uniref:hypothetical protein n=1 Tax=Marivita sp. TaxID=2003365 RepID=UPI003F4AF14D
MLRKVRRGVEKVVSIPLIKLVIPQHVVFRSLKVANRCAQQAMIPDHVKNTCLILGAVQQYFR